MTKHEHDDAEIEATQAALVMMQMAGSTLDIRLKHDEEEFRREDSHVISSEEDDGDSEDDNLFDATPGMHIMVVMNALLTQH